MIWIKGIFFLNMQQSLGTFLLSFVNHGLQSGGVVERSDLVSTSALAFPEPQFPYLHTGDSSSAYIMGTCED